MRNKKAWEKGERKYQALGGAAKMTAAGKALIEREFGGAFGASGRPAEEADDARFYVEAAPGEIDSKVRPLIERFSNQDASFFETDVLRETHEDLVSDGVLTEEEFASVAAAYEGAVSPIPWETTTSERETQGTPSRRIFHLFELVMPEAVAEKLKRAESLRVLSPSDLEDIHEATSQGNPAARTKDGSVIVENIFI
jgi:hypothetical protein